MSVTFTKLFSSITESTIWCEPDATRIVWITMLAMADSRGRVWASIPGLANRARVTVEQAEAALTTFSQPDRYSRTPDHDGRRVEQIDGGWRLLNHEKYRSIRDEESIKESKRKYINARRAEERASKPVEVEVLQSNSVERGRHNADADADADADTDTNTKKTAPRKRSAPTSVEKPADVCEQVWQDWKTLRKDKRASVTATVVESAREEAAKAGVTFEAFLKIWCRRGSQGLEASWLKPAEIGGAAKNTGKHNFSTMDYTKGVNEDGTF